MNAVIKVSTTEFNLELFNRLQEIFKQNKNGVVTIAYNDSDAVIPTETSEEYEQRLLNSIKQLDEGKTIAFTMESLAEYLNIPTKK